MKDPQPSINRRRFIKLTAFSAAGFQTLKTTAAPTEANKKEQTSIDQPERSVVTDRPILLPHSITNCTQKVPSGRPIQHRLPWKTVADENKDALTNIKEAAQYSFIIDGEYIPESAGEWIYELSNRKEKAPINNDTSTEYWRLEWTYTTLPKDPGVHNFTTTIQFNRPHTSKINKNETRTWSGTNQYRGQYEVIPLNTHPEDLST